jgi:hypothetical protein
MKEVPAMRAIVKKLLELRAMSLESLSVELRARIELVLVV